MSPLQPPATLVPRSHWQPKGMACERLEVQGRVGVCVGWAYQRTAAAAAGDGQLQHATLACAAAPPCAFAPKRYRFRKRTGRAPTLSHRGSRWWFTQMISTTHSDTCIASARTRSGQGPHKRCSARAHNCDARGRHITCPTRRPPRPEVTCHIQLHVTCHMSRTVTRHSPCCRC